MKELSIEEKAKSYDEALKKAKQFHNKDLFAECNGNLVEYIFESEDEKVRKALIRFHKSTIDVDGIKGEDIIAWLEKQGEQKNKINSCKITFEDVLALECAMKTIKITEGGNDLYEMLVRLYNKVHNAYLVEKQGETFTKKDVDDAYLKGICDAKHELEKQVEQKSDDKIEHTDYNSIDPHFGKPIDKIEPKFNFSVGQWIVATGKCVYLITQIDGFNVTLVDVDGNEYVFDTSSLEDARLWTINDAKDGDVLVCKGNIKYSNGIKYERICLFNNVDKAFFTLTKNSNSIEEYDIDVNIDYPDNTVPATKEQRDFLFEKMHEAGYEWDAEKKEVKKIEDEPENYKQQVMSEMTDLIKDCIRQKPTDKIAPSDGFENLMDLTDFERVLASICIGWIGGELGWKQYIKDNADVLLKIAIEKFNSVQDVPFEQKSAWSEEDERNLKGIIDEIEANKASAPSYDIETYDRFLSFLKSLKQRIGE